MDEAFKIAGYKTKGIHVSYDLDVIDPKYAPGVSTSVLLGITEKRVENPTRFLYTKNFVFCLWKLRAGVDFFINKVYNRGE